MTNEASEASEAVLEKHYAVFYSPGSFFAESSEREVPSWDPRAAAPLAATVVERHGATPYAFRFVTYLEREPVSDGRGGDMKVEPKRVAESGLFFLGGKLTTFGEVEARAEPRESILRSNMRCAESSIVCENTENRYRSTIPFREDDVLCDREGNIIERGDDLRWKVYREKIAARFAAENGY